MIAMVWRTISVRIHPNELLVFSLYASGDQENDEGGGTLQEEGACPAGEQQQSARQADGGELSLTTRASETETGQEPQHGVWEKVLCNVKANKGGL